MLNEQASHAVTNTAVALCDTGTNPLDRQAILDTIRTLCRKKDEFTVDDIHESMGEEFMTAFDPEGKGRLGPIMRQAAKEGLIRRTSRTVHCLRPEAHRKHNPVWEVL